MKIPQVFTLIPIFYSLSTFYRKKELIITFLFIFFFITINQQFIKAPL